MYNVSQNTVYAKINNLKNIWKKRRDRNAPFAAFYIGKQGISVSKKSKLITKLATIDDGVQSE